mmetsp:Transcript_19124/g.45035  ORF Transcript_19124/g.45035 Transcript_19124/m.45035 type:complete len:204 (+) Transcript_19124:903-1514(+)
MKTPRMILSWRTEETHPLGRRHRIARFKIKARQNGRVLAFHRTMPQTAKLLLFEHARRILGFHPIPKLGWDFPQALLLAGTMWLTARPIRLLTYHLQFLHHPLILVTREDSKASHSQVQEALFRTITLLVSCSYRTLFEICKTRGRRLQTRKPLQFRFQACFYHQRKPQTICHSQKFFLLLDQRVETATLNQFVAAVTENLSS